MSLIIHNLKGENHLSQIYQIFKDAEEVIIISPFITKDPNLFPFSGLAEVKKITFVTTLKAFEKDQYSKVAYFKELYNKMRGKGVEIDIHIENSLHGKIYIGSHPGIAKAIITSANFTHRGLRLNNEWGVLIDDLEEICKIKDGVVNKVVYKKLDEAFFDRCLERIKEEPEPKGNKPVIGLDLTLLLENRDNPYEIPTTATYWLKPIGVSSDIIPRNRKFDEVTGRLRFSKLRPRAVKRGDILICYAVGHKNILSIYRVDSGLQLTGVADDRWPHFFDGENLTPNYGRKWMDHNITISNQREEALSKSLKITPSGKNSYGSLMRGADKLRITPEFGDYLLNTIGRLNIAIRESDK